MKKIHIILPIFLMLTTSVLASSKLNPEVHHFFVVDGAAGYSTLFNTSPTDVSSAIKSGPGAGGMLGLGYRLKYNHFLFSFGVEGQYMYYTNAITDASLNLRMKDTEGDIFVMQATVEDCADVLQAANVAVPVLFGGEYGAFYFLAGAKIAYNFYGKASSSAYLTTKGQYETLIGPFENMPNHEFVNGQQIISGDMNCSLNMNVLAHLEIGGRIGNYSLLTGANVPHPLHRWYIAGYIDCGVLNVYKNSAENGSILRYTGGETGNDKLTFYVTPSMLSDNWKNAFISNLSVGVKVTYLLEAKEGMWGIAYHQNTNTYTRKGNDWNLPNHTKKQNYTGNGQLYQPKKCKPYDKGTQLYHQNRVKNKSNKQGRLEKETNRKKK